MRVIEQMLSRYAREEGHHALRGKQGHSLGENRGKQGHSLIFHLRGAPWAPWSTTERELGTAGTGGNWGQSPYFLHISRKNIGLLVSAYALLPKEVRSHVR